MWNADPDAARRSHTPRGFTLIEMMIVIGLVAMMSFALTYAVDSTQAADAQLETAGRAALHGQRLTNDIAALASASRMIYHGDATGAGYLAACDLSARPPAPDARLPVLDALNDLDADAAGASRTGNLLLLVSETTGSPCVADKKLGKTWTIDTYRITAVYPVVTNRSITRDGAPARDVVVWRSEAFPSLQQIMEIPDAAERKSVVQDLVDRYKFEFAWDPRLPAETAFHSLQGKGGVSDFPVAGVDILEDEALGGGARLLRANVRLAPTDPERHVRRAVLTADELGGWQPHGLELKLSGPSMARKLWIRSVVEASTQTGLRLSVHATTTIADAREY